MGFWDDVGAASEEFNNRFTSARRFRIQRQSDQQRQALQRQELEIREGELNSRLAKQQEEKQIREQIRILANEYNRILSTPTPGVWDFQNHTITDKAAAELIKISAQIAALDPQTGATYGRYVDMIYQTPKPPTPKPNAVVEKFEGLKAIGYPEDRARQLAGGEKETGEAGDSEDKIIRDLTTDFLKDDRAIALAKAQAEAQGKIFDPVEYGTTKAIQALSIIERAKTQREAHRQRLKTQQTGSSNVGELRTLEGNAPIEESLINEPEDTVVVDINDPRLRDTTFTESPFGIDVNAPATEDNEPIDENDVLDKLDQLKTGKKPFNSYKAGRQYFLKAKQKGLIDQSFYDVTHNKYLSPTYPDTAR